MRLGAPIVTFEGDEVRVSAPVEVLTARTTFPEELWFRFPRQYADWITDRLDGFAVSLLPLAQYLGEDLQVEGALSPRLLNGLMEYQRFQVAWKPSPFKPVRIDCELEPARAEPPPVAVASSFSGGVDSFHTLWSHLGENEPIERYRISHCLMINGFDADTALDGNSRFNDLQNVLQPALSKYGVGLINCTTNYQAFSDAKLLKQTFGAMVVVPALVLGNGFHTFYVPSSFRFDTFFRDGSHLMLDHLVSTETLQTVHDSAHLDRLQRTAVVADWDASYKALRVCFNATGFDADTQSLTNCGRCEKCVRTMKTLECLDRLDRYTVFPRKAGHLAVWKCHIADKGSRLFAREVMGLAWRKGRYGIWADYVVALAISFITKWPLEGLRQVHLYFEEHSETYARTVRRLFPRLRRRAHWIR